MSLSAGQKNVVESALLSIGGNVEALKPDAKPRSGPLAAAVLVSVSDWGAERRRDGLPSIAAAGFTKDKAGSGANAILNAYIAHPATKEDLRHFAARSVQKFPNSKPKRRRYIVDELNKIRAPPGWQKIAETQKAVQKVRNAGDVLDFFEKKQVVDRVVATAVSLIFPPVGAVIGAIVGVMDGVLAFSRGQITKARAAFEGPGVQDLQQAADAAKQLPNAAKAAIRKRAAQQAGKTAGDTLTKVLPFLGLVLLGLYLADGD